MLGSVQAEIMRLKKEKDICILAHSYQGYDIVEVADFTGDSYQLSVEASKVSQKTIIMCGVRFMAETVKILSPEKKVILANPVAGCPMAEQMDREMITKVKEEYPDYTVVAYINTSAELKTVCDVCVTSSSAVDIVNKIDNKNILFIPDCNLGAYVAGKVEGKNIKLLDGGCPIHAAVTAQDVVNAKKRYPRALVLAHPECTPEVLERADFIGSTSQILDYVNSSDHDEFLIGTEVGVVEHLQYTNPTKKVLPLSRKLVCPDMRVTTLNDVLNSVKGTGGEEIILPEDIIRDAAKSIEQMIRLGS
ncbi:MAG: quinolinate synthase NadA [Clostridiales bacterium]|nr:quinolinate synthase NadA [Clostridiales bacterium]